MLRPSKLGIDEYEKDHIKGASHYDQVADGFTPSHKYRTMVCKKSYEEEFLIFKFVMSIIKGGLVHSPHLLGLE